MDATTNRTSRIPASMVLKINIGLGVGFGVLMLAATWADLYDTLDIPQPLPWVYAQLFGALLLGAAWMAWKAADDVAQGRTVAQGLAIFDAIGAVVIIVWLASDDIGVPDGGSLGSWIFIATAAGMAVLAVLQGRAFRHA
ncbi:MAG: hypothetical protein R6X23_05815 [Acidimicrobiia bacterium]